MSVKVGIETEIVIFFLLYCDMWQFWINSNFKPTEVIMYFVHHPRS